jgi:hypothetical protein
MGAAAEKGRGFEALRKCWRDALQFPGLLMMVLWMRGPPSLFGERSMDGDVLGRPQRVLTSGMSVIWGNAGARDGVEMGGGEEVRERGWGRGVWG